ncbi:MAG: alpha/beta hydrolase [Rhodospirillales bacterium]|nr:alpha/beta hydrolase [Rhodospirillales bacterium]
MRNSVYSASGPLGSCDIAYTDWGDLDNPDLIVCVHGLTRNCRDFDALAQVLSATYRVISIDVPGRGNSQRLASPAAYTYPTYIALLWPFIASLKARNLDFIGTSMGGIIGMMIAAMPESPIQRMVVNDVGPFLPKSALQRINTYLAMDFQFDSVAAVAQHLRRVHEPFGPLTDAQWAHLAEHGSRRGTDGRWRLAYDPAIREPFKDVINEDISFWEVWDAIRCPVLLLRGETSDILRPETALEMTQHGPATDLVEFAGIGHAPALMAPEQISTITDWLSRKG